MPQRQPQCGLLRSGKSQWALVWVRCVVRRHKPKSLCRQFDPLYSQECSTTRVSGPLLRHQQLFNAWVGECPAVMGTCKWFLNRIAMAVGLEKLSESKRLCSWIPWVLVYWLKSCFGVVVGIKTLDLGMFMTYPCLFSLNVVSSLWRITSFTPRRVWSTGRTWRSFGSWHCPKSSLP